MSLDELAQIDDRVINSLKQEELDVLYERYDLLQIRELLNHSIIGVRKYLEASKDEYFKLIDGLEEDEKISLPKRLRKAKYLDLLQSFYNKFPEKLPNQKQRWLYIRPEYKGEEQLPLFEDINEILYPGREYRNLNEKLFPPEKYRGKKNPDFGEIIRVSKGADENFWYRRGLFLTRKNMTIDHHLINWRWYAHNNPKLQEKYVNFMIQETHLVMLLLKKGYDIKQLTETIEYE